MWLIRKREECTEVGAERRAQRSEIRDQRAESRKQRAESRDQRSESREQRAESREQRAESREQKRAERAGGKEAETHKHAHFIAFTDLNRIMAEH
jgi:hypothetical protein